MSVAYPAKPLIPVDNRPIPLRATSAPLLADDKSQMSFGERAALVGLLSEVKPRLALEIGTYDGGSLGFLAAHSEHVHTLDLHEHIEDQARFKNVTFHIGDSTLLLPGLLSAFEAEGHPIDFALIDGDHSSEGVRQDLTNLLDSTAAASTVILLHDTMNCGVRAGVEQVGLSTRSGVVYHELDFVPGYEYAGGHFDGQVWGGLGLVITGDRDATGYGDAPAQTRYRPAFEFLHETQRLRLERDQALRDLDVTRHWLTVVQSSASWRMTAPLRSAKKWLSVRR